MFQSNWTICPLTSGYTVRSRSPALGEIPARAFVPRVVAGEGEIHLHLNRLPFVASRPADAFLALPEVPEGVEEAFRVGNGIARKDGAAGLGGGGGVGVGFDDNVSLLDKVDVDAHVEAVPADHQPAVFLVFHQFKDGGIVVILPAGIASGH